MLALFAESDGRAESTNGLEPYITSQQRLGMVPSKAKRSVMRATCCAAQMHCV